MRVLHVHGEEKSGVTHILCPVQWHRKDFLIGRAQFKTIHRVVSNLYNNL